ncbi:MAG: hypothetical protein AB7O37_09645 [Vicinamibacteria bacterium]
MARHVLVLSLAAALAAGPAGAADAPVQGPEPSPSAPSIAADGPALTLVLFDLAGAIGGMHGVLRAEVDRVFAPTGLAIEHRKGGLGTTLGADGRRGRELAVIVLPDAPAPLRGRSILGLVPGNGGDTPAAIWVFAQPTRATLRLPQRAEPDAADRALLARALGRVVAHEVVHALAPRLPHSLGGLMRHSLNREDLLGPLPAVSEGSLRAIRLSLSPGPVRVAAPAATLLAERAQLPF